jgi:hypothetical protein
MHHLEQKKRAKLHVKITSQPPRTEMRVLVRKKAMADIA